MMRPGLISQFRAVARRQSDFSPLTPGTCPPGRPPSSARPAAATRLHARPLSSPSTITITLQYVRWLAPPNLVLEFFSSVAELSVRSSVKDYNKEYC